VKTDEPLQLEILREFVSWQLLAAY